MAEEETNSRIHKKFCFDQNTNLNKLERNDNLNSPVRLSYHYMG